MKIGGRHEHHRVYFQPMLVTRGGLRPFGPHPSPETLEEAEALREGTE